MSWEALGHDPVPGDPGVALRLSVLFGEVCDQAEQITSRLRALDAGSGPEVWRGQAADAFRDKLSEIGPDLIRMAMHHRHASEALRDFAHLLDEAQATARRAASDAGSAIVDRDAAAARRNIATRDAVASDGTALLADGRIAQARLQAATVGTLDPTYQAAMQTYEQQVAAQRDAARARASEARRRAGAAASDVASAQARVEAARRLADQAAAVRDDAARTAAARIRAADAPGYDDRSLLDKVWDGASSTVRRISRGLDDLTSRPEFQSFLNILSDIGDLMSGIGTALSFLSFIPGVGAIAAAFLITAAAFKGLAFLGTLVSALYGNASGKQVAGRAIDFGLSLTPLSKALKAAKAVRSGPITKLAGELKRAINYRDPNSVRGVLAPFDAADKFAPGATKVLGKLHVDPQTAFRAKTAYSVVAAGRNIAKSADSLVETGQHLSQDIQKWHNPDEKDLLQEEAPRLAKKLAGDAAASTMGDGIVGKIGKAAAEYDAAQLTKMVMK